MLYKLVGFNLELSNLERSENCESILVINFKEIIFNLIYSLKELIEQFLKIVCFIDFSKLRVSFT